MCEVCGKRPKFIEKNGLVHPYCGRTCARADQAVCKSPTCNSPTKPAFSGYCGYEHAREAVQDGLEPPCAECGTQPKAAGDLCFECNNSPVALTGSRLRELNLQELEAALVIDNFKNLWKGDESATIGRVYRIRLPPNIVKAREAYYSKLAAVGKPRLIQTFHTTQCICDLGTNKVRFCTWRSCGICAIIRSAFTTFEFGIKSNTGRFGSGIYSYLEPSLADRWAVPTTSSPYMMMLACEVTLLPPQVRPPRFSGILQSREDGPSVFVPVAEAIIPVHLILYSKGKPSPTQLMGTNRSTSTHE